MYPLSSDLRPLVLCEHRIEALTNEAMHCDPVLGGQDFELLPNIGLDVNGDEPFHSDWASGRPSVQEAFVR